MNLIEIRGTKGVKFYRAIADKLAEHPSIVKATVEKNDNGHYMVVATGLSISDEEIHFTLIFSDVTRDRADITLTAYSSLLNVNTTWDINPWTFDERIAADQIGMLLPTIV